MNHSAAGATGGNDEGSDVGLFSYRVNYRANYRVGLCSWDGPRPRQHWRFALLSSPTTRPPRGNTDGEGAGSRTRACAWLRCWLGRGQTGCEEQTVGIDVKTQIGMGKGKRQLLERHRDEIRNKQVEERDGALARVLDVGRGAVG